MKKHEMKWKINLNPPPSLNPLKYSHTLMANKRSQNRSIKLNNRISIYRQEGFATANVINPDGTG